MFGKLLKNEFISTGRIMGILYAVVLVIMGYLLGSYYIGRNAADADPSNGQIVGVFLLMMISFCSFILTTIVMITNFQKTLYGDQGYLSFTLPVKSTALLASKVIVSTLWYVAAFLCLLGTAAISFYVLREDVLGAESYDLLEQMLPMVLGGKSVATMITSALISMITIFIRFAIVAIEVYFAISLANTRHFQKHYLLWTIVFSGAIIYIIEQLTTLITRNVVFGLSVENNTYRLITDFKNMSLYGNYVDLAGLMIAVVAGVAFFFATRYVMKNKVNIR
jgi:hypothetical protein